MNELPSPNRLKLIKELKKLSKNYRAIKSSHIACDPVCIDGSPVIVRGYHICHHDLYHLEVSDLDRIKIGKSWVSGIHGINCPIFHDFYIEEEYDGILDEARVACHEWLTRTSWLNSLKILLWLIWLAFRGINPFAVLYRHHQTLKSWKKLESFESKSRD